MEKKKKPVFLLKGVLRVICEDAFFFFLNENLQPVLVADPGEFPRGWDVPWSRLSMDASALVREG